MSFVTFLKHHMELTVGYACIRSDEYLAVGNKTEHAACKC